MADEQLKRPLSSRFDVALARAAWFHRQQARKGTQIPYVAHLLAVASLVLEHGGNEDQAIAALLHDALEDQDVTKDELRRDFGAQVLEIVEGCTDAIVGKAKPPWRARKKRYVAHVRRASPLVKLVSAADKLHNAKAILLDYNDLGERLWSRFNAGKKDQLWYYRSLVKAFRSGRQSEGLRRLVDELDRVVSKLESPTGSTVSSSKVKSRKRTMVAVQRGRAREFHDGDDGYGSAHNKFMKWLRANRDGYYLTVKSASKVNLHKADCTHQGDYDFEGTNSATHDKKVCAHQQKILTAWAKKNGFRIHRCGSCL